MPRPKKPAFVEAEAFFDVDVDYNKVKALEQEVLNDAREIAVQGMRQLREALRDDPEGIPLPRLLSLLKAILPYVLPAKVTPREPQEALVGPDDRLTLDTIETALKSLPREDRMRLVSALSEGTQIEGTEGATQ